MGKRGRSRQNKEIKSTKKSTQFEDSLSSEEMDDEIDAFHKQRDIVPLDINDDVGESDEDDEHPIFDLKGIDDDKDNDDDDDDDDDDSDIDDKVNDNVAKMIRQRRYLRAKFGGSDNEMHYDDDEVEEDNEPKWGGRKFLHGAENRNFEIQSSDDEAPKEEEEVAMQMQREKAKSLTMEDYGLVGMSDNEIDGKLTLKELVHVTDASKSSDANLTMEDTNTTYTVEDLNAMSKEEKMNALYRSAPELISWLSELNEAHEQLEHKINPLLSKVKNGDIVIKGGVNYFELKQLLLLSYCQAITFYLLLKSEGQPVRDHPVVTRLEEIKKMLDQIKLLDAKLPAEIENILIGNHQVETVVKLDTENAPTTSNSLTINQGHLLVSAETLTAAVPQQVVEMPKVDSLKDNVSKAKKLKYQKDHIGMQSLEMLKVRASLEEKLKQRGWYSSIAPKPSGSLKRLRPVNGQLETYDDFDDDAVDVEGVARSGNDLGSSKIKVLSANQKKPKVVSGDDDLPKRDDIGERRRKHELRVLAGAGIKSEDDVEEIGNLESDKDAEEVEDVNREDSENELYEQVKQQRAVKLAAKAETFSRNSAIPSLPETVEGKRQISHQMEKNRGLTRSRKKQNKNPRKKYREKHQKAVKNRSGQVRTIIKPTRPYGGETSGINAAISRSIRFKS